MQTSMGQAATTLTGLLDMHEEQMDGDSEGLVENHLLQARKTLIEAVQTGGDCTAPLNQLLQLKCPISMKYAQLNVRQLLKDNNEVCALGLLAGWLLFFNFSKSNAALSPKRCWWGLRSKGGNL